MNRKCFAIPPKFKTRMFLMLCGVLVQGFGLSLLIRLCLGTDPCSCFTQGVTCHVPISFGTAQLLCHLVTFSFVIALDRSFIGFGTIGNMVFLGYIADLFGFFWDHFFPEAFFQTDPVRFVFLIPVLIIFMFGAAAYMTAGLGSSPYDALPFILTARLKKIPFKAVRILWDLGFMIAGTLLGGNFGIVTIAVAFFFGPIISWMQKKLSALLSSD